MRLTWHTVLAVLVLAGTIHVAAVLSLPFLARENGWMRLSALGETNKLVILPSASPTHQSIPLMAPDVRYAVCRYDLTSGPVRLLTQILDDLWLIAFYTPRGDNFYTISGADIQRQKVEIVISSEDEQIPDFGAEAEKDTENVLVVTVPKKQGLVLIRAPLPGPSYDARTESTLRGASCAPMLSAGRSGNGASGAG